MKKLLTVAAILAASSALASAATTTTFADLTASSTTDGVSYDSSTGTITATTTTDLFTSSSSTDNNYTYSATTLTLALDYSALTSADTSELISLATVSTGSDTYSIGLGVTGGYFVWTWQGVSNGNIVQLSAVSDKVDDNGYLTVTVVINSTEIGGTSTAPAGSRLYFADGTTYYTGSSMRASNVEYTQVTVDSDYVAGITVTSGSVTDSSTIATASTTLAAATAAAAAVPEPSAFGLLAGIGALALVAARRRRR